MKKLFASAIFLAVFTATAVLTTLFPGYDELKNRSSDIVVARCITNPPTLLHFGADADINTFSIEIVTAIKGTNFAGIVPLVSEQWLTQGDDYLIFGDCENGTCRAIEDFRVVPLGCPLGEGAITNSITGKSLDEEIQTLFKRAINNLDRQIKKDQEEKQRLEEGLKR